MEASGTNIDLSSVEFYIEGNSIKKDSVAPYTATVYDVSEGDFNAYLLPPSSCRAMI